MTGSIYTRILSICFWFLTTVGALSAQGVFPVAINGFMIPPRSLDLAVYATQRPTDLVFSATLVDPVEPFRDVRLKLYIESNGQIIYVTDPNAAVPTTRLFKDQEQVFNGFGLAPYLQSSSLVGATGDGTGSVIIPEGFDRIIVEVIDIQRNIPISRKAAVSGNFVLNDPPFTVLPNCGALLTMPPFQNQLFNWTPRHIGSLNPPGVVEYVFKLVEVLPGVGDPNDGFDNNLTIYQTTTMVPTLLYSMGQPQLQPDKTYAWRVQARSATSPGLYFRNNGYSNVCTFSYTTDDVGGNGPGGNEEQRTAPTACETFDTDFGPVSINDIIPALPTDGDVIKLGWFNLELTNVYSTGQGYSGEGLVNIPFLASKIKVAFSNIKVKEGITEKRIYEAASIRATVDNTFAYDPSVLNANNLATVFNEQYMTGLESFFTSGNGQNRKLSGFDPQTPQETSLPMAIDRDIEGTQQPLIVVTGIRFTPRNAFLTCVAYTRGAGNNLMRYAVFEVPCTPYGVKTNSNLTLLDANDTPLTEAFTLKVDGGGMGMYCLGFKSYELNTKVEVNPQIIAKASDNSAIRVSYSQNTNDPATYLGNIEDFADFAAPQMPGFTFSAKKGKIDFKTAEKLSLLSQDSVFLPLAENDWRGMYIGDVKVKLPAEYDFTGNQNRITLDKGALSVQSGGISGVFRKNAVVSLSDGRLGSWRYSVDTMQLNIVQSQTGSTTLAGRIRVPVLDEPFAYRSVLNISSDHTEMNVKPRTGVQTMNMWGATMDLNDSSEIKAKLRDLNGTRQFFPSAKLYGKLSLRLDATQFDAKLSGNKVEAKNQIKQILGLSGEPSFDLTMLSVRNLSIDPYTSPEDRYKIEAFGMGHDSADAGGKMLRIGEVSTLYQPETPNSPEQVGLKVILLGHSGMVQYVFWGKAASNGGYTFDRIEVQTENITCNCISMSDQGGFDEERFGMIKEMYYDKHYSPARFGFLEKPRSSGSLRSNGIVLQELPQDDEARYHQAIMEHLDRSTVGGFIMENNVLQLPWGDELLMEVAPQKLKLPWGDEIDITKAANYAATIDIKRTDSKFNFEDIDKMSSTGTLKLPLDLSNKLDKLGIKGTYAFPAKDHVRLLLTKFEVATSGASESNNLVTVNANATITAEFTILVKVTEGSTTKYLQFVHSSNTRLTATGLGLKDFFLPLESDVVYPGSYDLTLKTGTSTEAATGSYVKIDCDGFRGFNVQGIMGFAEDKVRSRKTAAEGSGDKKLTIATTITGNSLRNFTASVKAINPDGQPFNFVVPGAEAVVFGFGSSYEAYLDMDAQTNPVDFPANYSGGGTDGSFKGLYLKKLECRLEGFKKGTASVSVDCEKFIVNANGVEGKVGRFNVVDPESNSTVGGWKYTLDTLGFELKNSKLAGSKPGINLAGRIKMPIIKGDFWLKYTGVLGFVNTGTQYQPSGEFRISVAEFSKAFEFDGIGGLRVQFSEGTAIGFKYVPGGSEGGGEFTPYASLSGNAALFLNSKLKESLGFDPGMSMEYELISFQGFEINPQTVSAAQSAGTAMQSTGSEGAISSANSGAWGTRPKGSKVGSLRSPQGSTEPPAPADATSDGGKGLQGFPLVINSVGFVSSSGQFSLKLDFTVNLSKSKNSSGSGGSGGGSGEEAEASGLSATTKLAVNFKLENGKFSNANVSNKVELEGFAVKGKFGPVEFEGEMEVIKDDPKFGSGFKAMVTIDVKAINVVGVAQFGTTTYNRQSGTTGDYRYFFIDLEVTHETGLVLVPTPVKIALHGIGGGFYYNMEKEAPVTERTLTAIPEPTNLMDPGVSWSGFKYTPKEGGFGGYLSAIASLVSPQVIAADAALGIEIQINNAGTLSFSKIFFRGATYFVADDVKSRKTSAKAKGTVDLDMDFINATFSGSIGFEMSVEIPSVFELYTCKAGGEKGPLTCNFLVNFKTLKWYLKAGRPIPNEYLALKLKILSFLEITTESYFQVGYDIDPMPNINTLIPDWNAGGTAGSRLAAALYQGGNGMAFGLKFGIPKKSFDFLCFSASFQAGAGFDLSMIKYNNLTCNGKGVGMDGWWMQGQAYAYLSGRLDMNYDLKFKKGTINLFSLNVAAALQAKFPNPSEFKGQIKGQFSVLGGMIKGSVNFKLRIISDKDKACLDAMVQGAVPVAGIPIISETYPAKDVSGDNPPIFVQPKLVFNMAQGKVLEFEEYDSDDKLYYRRYRTGVEYFRLKKGTEVVTTQTIPEAFTMTLKPTSLLLPKTKYTLEYKVYWEEDKSGTWTKISNGEETGTIEFTTGDMPDKIYAEALSYHAPGNKQRYWHKDYAKPRIAFSAGNWSSLFPASVNETINGQQKTIPFDYVIRLTAFSNGTEGTTTDIPLSEYPGLQTFEVPVQTIKTIGTYYSIPYVTIQQQPGLNVGFNGLNDFALEKGKMYRLKIMRLPVVPSAETKTEEVSDTTGITLTVQKLGGAVENLLAKHAKELYEYWFAVSNYDNLHAKLEAMTKQWTPSSLYRTDMGHPKDELLPGVSNSYLPPTLDDYYTFYSATEGIDAYDLTRIRLNMSKPDYKDTWSVETKMKDYTILTDAYHMWGQEWAREHASSISGFSGGGSAESYRSFFNEILKDYKDVDDWHYHFNLVDNGYDKLSDSEISGKKLLATWSGKKVKDGAADNIFDNNVNFSMVYHDLHSRIRSNQGMYMNLMAYLAFREKVEWYLGGPIWGSFLQNFPIWWYTAAGATYTTQTISRKDGTAYLWVNSASIPWSSGGYLGKTELKFPKLAKWNDMGQKVSDPSMYNQLVINFPARTAGATSGSNAGNSSSNGTGATFTVTTLNESNTWSMKPKDYQTDQDYSRLMVKRNDKVVMVYADGEADLYDANNNRLILYSKTFPLPGENIAELFSQANVSGYDKASLYPASGNYTVHVKKGSATNASASFSTASDWPVSSSSSDITRKKLLRFGRAIGANPLMFTMKEIGEGDPFTTGAFIVYDDQKRAIFHRSASGVKTVYSYPSSTSYAMSTITTAQPEYQFELENNKWYRVMVKTSKGTKAFDITSDFYDQKFGISVDQFDANGTSNWDARPEGAPFGAAPVSLPGKIEAENFDKGGEGISYHDTDWANLGNVYRPDEKIDITGGSYSNGYAVGWVESGEWMDYTVNVTQAGQYDLFVWYSGVGTVRCEINGQSLTLNPIELPSGNQTFKINKNIQLNAGKQTLRLYVIDKGFNLDCLELLLSPMTSVFGNGLPVPNNVMISADPANATDFGIVAGGEEKSAVFTINNTGPGVVTLEGSAPVTVSGSTKFSVSAQAAGSIAVGGSTTFTVKYLPVTTPATLEIATVSFSTSGQTKRTYSFVVQAGPPPEIDVLGNNVSISSGDISPSTSDFTDFGSLAADKTKEQTFTIKNTGLAKLKLSGSPLVAVSGPNAAAFTVTQPTVSELNSNASTTFKIKYKPNGDAGIQTATITILNNDGDESNYQFMVQGTLPGAEIAVSGNDTPIAHNDNTPNTTKGTDFGNVQSDVALSRVFSVFNLGSSALTLSGTTPVTIDGTDKAQFVVTSQPDASVAVGGNTSFVIKCQPNKTGTLNATVKIANNDANENPYTFAIKANAIAPDIEVDFQVNYDGVYKPLAINETPSADKGTKMPYGTNNSNYYSAFRISNKGNSPLRFVDSKLSVSGDVDGFRVSLSDMDKEVAANGFTMLIVQFDKNNASKAGLNEITVSIKSNDPDEGNYTFKITAEGRKPQLELNTLCVSGVACDGVRPTLPQSGPITVANSPVNFGQMELQYSSTAKFIISNLGDYDLLLNAMSFTGANASDFSILPGYATTLPRYTSNYGNNNYSSTVFSVVFAPSGFGAREAKLRIPTNDPLTPVLEIPFKGEGTGDALQVVWMNPGGGEVIIPKGNVSSGTPASAEYGTILGPNATHTFRYKNIGTADITDWNQSLYFNPDAMEVTGLTCTNCPLKGGQYREFTVKFKPAAGSGGGNSQSIKSYRYTLNLQKMYTPSSFSFADSKFEIRSNGVLIPADDYTPSIAENTDFGTVEAGVCKEHTFTITNKNTVAKTINSWSLGSSFGSLNEDGLRFGLNAYNENPSYESITIQPNASADFKIRYCPTSSGADDTAPCWLLLGGPGTNYGNAFMIKGTRAPMKSEISVFASYTYSTVKEVLAGSINTNDNNCHITSSTPSKTLSFEIKNTNYKNLEIGTIQKLGADAADFTVTYDGVTTIQKGAYSNPKCTVKYTGSKANAYIKIRIPNNDDDENPFDFNVSYGTPISNGIDPVFLYNLTANSVPITGSYNFGDIDKGTAGKEVTFTLTYPASANITIPANPLSIASGSDFAITQALTTPVNQSGTMTATFKIKLTALTCGSRTAVLNVNFGTGLVSTINLNGATKGTIFLVERDYKSNLVANGGTHNFLQTVPNPANPEMTLFYIRNNGCEAANLPPNAVSLSNTTDFSIIQQPLGGSLDDTPRPFKIQFKPTTWGEKTATMTINCGSGISYQVTLKGMAAAAVMEIRRNGTAIASGSAVTLGTTEIGSSGTEVFTVHNIGNLPLNFGTDAWPSSQYVLFPECNAWMSGEFGSSGFGAQSISPGASANLNVVFTPKCNIGTKNGSINFKSDNGGSFTFNFSAAAIQAKLKLTKGQEIIVDDAIKLIGEALVNASDGPKMTFMLTNTGNTAMKLNSNWVAFEAPTSDFILTKTELSSLDAGKTTTFTVQLKPSTIGDRRTGIWIRTVNGGVLRFDVKGFGIKPQPEISRGPISIVTGALSDFGMVAVNQLGPEILFTINNTGTGALMLPATALSLSSSTHFEVFQPLTNTIPSEGSTTFKVRFKPTATGVQQTDIKLTTTNGGTFSFKLIGIGEAPEIDIQEGSRTVTLPDTIQFGNVSAGSTLTKRFKIFNLGGSALNLTGTPKVAVDGTNATDFVVSLQPAAGMIAPGDTQIFEIKFAPGNASVRRRKITVSSNDSDESKYEFIVQGTGVIAAEIDIRGKGTSIVNNDNSPSPDDDTDFGTVLSGVALSKTFTIYNTGGAPLDLTESGNIKVTIAGNAAADFSVAAADQPASPIAPGGAASFVLTCNSTTLGTRNATVKIKNSDSDESNYTFSVRAKIVLPNAEVKSTAETATSYTAAEETTIAFGAVAPNTTLTKKLKIWNPAASGAYKLRLIMPATLPEGYTVALSDTAVSPQKSVTLSVSFKPTVAGAIHNAPLVIGLDKAPVTSLTINLTGSGLQSAAVAKVTAHDAANSNATAKTTLAFGTVVTGTNNQQSLKIWNTVATGGASLTVTLPATMPEGYTANLSSNTIEPGGSALLNVSFNALAPKAYNSTFNLTFQGATTTSQTITLTGTGTSTVKAKVTDNSANSSTATEITALTFATNQNVGTTSAELSFKIWNTATSGNMTVTLPDNMPASYSAYFDSGNSVSIAPNASASVKVKFTPVFAADNNQDLVLSLSNGQLDQKIIQLKGKGIPVMNAVGDVTLCPATPGAVISFGGVPEGTTYTWTNNKTSIGLAASGSGNISFTPTATGEATITVTPKVGTISGTAKTFKITVFAAPTAAIALSGTQDRILTASGGATYNWSTGATTAAITPNVVGVYTVTVTGSNGCTATKTTSLTSAISIKGNSKDIPNSATTAASTTNGTDFGDDAYYTANTMKYTISNTGTGDLIISSIVTSGTDADAFVPSLANMTIGAGKSKDMELTFTPTEYNKTYNASLKLTTNVTGTNALYEFKVKGTGRGSDIDVKGGGTNLATAVVIADGSTTPATTNATKFADTNVSTPKTAKFYIVNSGLEALNITDISVDGTKFQIIGETTQTIAPGASYTFDVKFQPVVKETCTQTVTVTSDAKKSADKQIYTFKVSCTVK